MRRGMRPTIVRPCRLEKRDYNRRFQEMYSHHLVEPVACTPGAGWEKGQVERQVGDVRGRLFVPSPRGRSYAEINEWLMDRCIKDAKKHPHPTIPGKTVWQVFEEERPPAHLPAERDRTVRPSTVKLKAALRQIDPDDVNPVPWTPPPPGGWSRHHLGTLRCRREEASTPSILHAV